MLELYNQLLALQEEFGGEFRFIVPQDRPEVRLEWRKLREPLPSLGMDMVVDQRKLLNNAGGPLVLKHFAADLRAHLKALESRPDEHSR